MRYLYGDATPFPLEENFIETLPAATDACVALFRADRELDERRQRAAAIRSRAAEEVARLETLSSMIEAALEPMFPTGEPEHIAQRKALEIRQLARASIEQTRASLLRESEESVSRTMGHDLGGRVSDALGTLLLRHQLPGMSWSVQWRHPMAGGQAELSLRAAAPCELVVEFTGQVPEGHRWSSPVRIADIDPEARISIRREGSWIGRLIKGSQETFTDFYITAVALRGKEARFEVHRQLKPGAPGYAIHVRGARLTAPLIYPLLGSPDGAPGGAPNGGGIHAEPIPVHEDEVAGLLRLWSTIERDMRELQGMRDRMRSATLRDVDVTHIGEPGVLAELILDALAPIVREMRLRSRVPGELVLKRDLGNGRREELFISRRSLEEKFAALPYEQQIYFQAAGLGSEATVEFVHRPFPQGMNRDMRTSEGTGATAGDTALPGDAAA